MGIDLGGLLQGAITGARGVQEGIAARRKMEQQALRQMLMDRLTNAQIGNYESQIQTRGQPKPTVPKPPMLGTPEYLKAQQQLAEMRARVGAQNKPPAPPNALAQKNQAGAGTAVESIDDAERLLVQNPNADVLPDMASIARGASTLPIVGGALQGALEPIAQRSMTPDQQQFQADMQRMAHSMVGLLPGSRQSIVLFNSLVNAYTPQPGESAQTRTAKRTARLRARHWLDAVRRGEQVPMPPELSAAGITDADIHAPTTDEEGAPADYVPAPAPPKPSGTPKPKYHPRFRQP